MTVNNNNSIFLIVRQVLGVLGVFGVPGVLIVPCKFNFYLSAWVYILLGGQL